MTEQEFRVELEFILTEQEFCGCSHKGCQDDLAKGIDKILTLIKEAGFVHEDWIDWDRQVMNYPKEKEK